MGIDMCGMSMNIAAVQRPLYFTFQVLKIHLCAPIEVCQLHIEVIDNFCFGRTLGKKNSGSAAECLRVELMRRYKRKDVLQHGLLSSVVRDRGFHDCHKVG